MSDLPTRLRQVGDLERRDHAHLTPSQCCFFWGEYTPLEHTGGKLWNYSATNQLILNLKKPVDRVGTGEWPHKVRAIQTVGAMLAQVWKWHDFHALGLAVVPMPPSRARDDPMYDPRMMQIAQQIKDRSGVALDVRDCLSFDGTLRASHSSTLRPTPDQLYGRLQFDASASGSKGGPKWIMVLDDMLTTGAHYVAAERVLKEHYPSATIFGCFIARRILPDPTAGFEDLTRD